LKKVLYDTRALDAEIKILRDYLTRYKFMPKHLKDRNKVEVLCTLRDMFIKMLEGYIIYVNAAVSW
jgi:hypothetical protein